MNNNKMPASISQQIAGLTGPIAIILNIILLLVCTYALWDVQTAQGVGLYLAIRMGLEHTAGLDILCAGAFIFILLLMILLPCLLLKHLSPLAFLRLFALYLAFIPAISTAYLVHLTDGPLFVISPDLWPGLTPVALYNATGYMFPVLQFAVPAFALLYGCGYALAENSDNEHIPSKFSFPRVFPALIFIAVLLMIATILFYPLAPLTEYLLWYVLLLTAFHIWEKLISASRNLQMPGHILTCLLLVRGIYRIMELISHYRL